MTGIYDDTMGNRPQKFRSEAHKAAWEESEADRQRAAKMYPEMKRVRERDASRSPSNPYPRMKEEQAAAEAERQAQFALTMNTQEGVAIRQAARDEIDRLMREARQYPTHRETTAQKIEQIEKRFETKDGKSWLEEM